MRCCSDSGPYPIRERTLDGLDPKEPQRRSKPMMSCEASFVLIAARVCRNTQHALLILDTRT